MTEIGRFGIKNALTSHFVRNSLAIYRAPGHGLRRLRVSGLATGAHDERLEKNQD